MDETIARNKVTKGTLILKNKPDVATKKPKKKIVIPKVDVKPAFLRRPVQDRGLIYVGHLPHGFYEKEMRAFFKQFGKVTNCRVNRSARTGGSKGFGYVEFLNPAVAKIAAETMHNYLMFKRRLITKYIEPSEQLKNIFRAHAWTARDYPMKDSRNISNRVYNNNAYVDYEAECRGMMKAVQFRLEKLKALGIDYDFKPSDVPEFIITDELNKSSEDEIRDDIMKDEDGQEMEEVSKSVNIGKMEKDDRKVSKKIKLSKRKLQKKSVILGAKHLLKISNVKKGK